jgi:hypothetical protein
LQNAGEFSAGNYFPTDKSVDRPGVLGPPWTDADADRGHRGAKWRGERGELGSGLTGARAALWRQGDGGAERGGGGAQ